MVNRHVDDRSDRNDGSHITLLDARRENTLLPLDAPQLGDQTFIHHRRNTDR